MDGEPIIETILPVTTSQVTHMTVDTNNAIEIKEEEEVREEKSHKDEPLPPATTVKRTKNGGGGGRTRVAAHEFRQKQKLYIYSLEKRVAELTAVNSEMQSRLHLMCNENNIIKEHLAYLRGFIAQAVPSSNILEQDPLNSTSSSTTTSSSSSTSFTSPDNNTLP